MMLVRDVVERLQEMPQDQEACFYIPDLGWPKVFDVNNWRDPVRFEAIKCEHDDYVLIELGRE